MIQRCSWIQDHDFGTIGVAINTPLGGQVAARELLDPRQRAMGFGTFACF